MVNIALDVSCRQHDDVAINTSCLPSITLCRREELKC
jgi:hypothetical protein